VAWQTGANDESSRSHAVLQITLKTAQVALSPLTQWTTGPGSPVIRKFSQRMIYLPF
jgi:hypothetical protein